MKTESELREMWRELAEQNMLDYEEREMEDNKMSSEKVVQITIYDPEAPKLLCKFCEKVTTNVGLTIQDPKPRIFSVCWGCLTEFVNDNCLSEKHEIEK